MINLDKLSVIVPIGPDDESWKNLLVDFGVLSESTEIIFVISEIENIPILSKYRCLKSPRGRAIQLNSGARESKNPFLWFLHADSRVSRLAFEGARDAYQNYPDFIHYFDLKFYGGGPLLRINEFGVRFRSKILKLPFGDQGLLMSRKIFEQVGGFDESRPRGEDLFFIWSSRRMRVPLRCTRQRILTSARKYKLNGWIKTTCLHLWFTFTWLIRELMRRT